MRQPTSINELRDTVDQAVFEFASLAVCVQEDIDNELCDYSREFEEMSRSLTELKESLASTDEYQNANGLAIMRRATQLRTIIPFYSMIVSLDKACKDGVTRA